MTDISNDMYIIRAAICEAAGMIERGELGAAEAECLGAINYLAGCVAWVREQATMRGKEAT